MSWKASFSLNYIQLTEIIQVLETLTEEIQTITLIPGTCDLNAS